MNTPWMIYGANGYSGRLIAELAAARGLTPVLAGRNRNAIVAMAEDLKLESRVFALDDPDTIRRELESMGAVLHAAGPFSSTALPMASACLESVTHYLDITGEIDVFESLHDLDLRAREKQVVLLPGVGFDVVPTDCAAARVATMVDRPTRLEIAFYHRGSTSPGTTKTMIEGLARRGKERRNSLIVPVEPGTRHRNIPFGDRERYAMGIPWGDVSTAFYSTGIPNITVYLAMPPQRARNASRLGALRSLLGTKPIQQLLKWLVTKTVSGPDVSELETGYARIWCQATNEEGQSATLELRTPHGYRLTADAAVSSVQALLSDNYAGPDRGFLTPSLAFGADFVTELEGVEWQ